MLISPLPEGLGEAVRSCEAPLAAFSPSPIPAHSSFSRSLQTHWMRPPCPKGQLRGSRLSLIT